VSPARKKDLPLDQACREAALRLLERKPHSVADLRRKLYKRKFGKALIDPLLEDLQRVGLLDDLNLSRDYCASRLDASPPVGRRRVLQELRRHGIPPDIANQALEEIWDAQEREMILELAREAARRKLRLIRKDEDPRKKRDKLYRYLAGRGFDTEIIRDVVPQLLDY